MFKKNLVKSLLVVSVFASSSLVAMDFDRTEGSEVIVELNRSEVFVPSRLGELSVVHDADGFHVIKDGACHNVPNHFVSKELRGISPMQLNAFLGRAKYVVVDGQMIEFTKVSKEEFDATVEKVEVVDALDIGCDVQAELKSTSGYVYVNQTSDGEYTLQAKSRLLGGGPSFGYAAYWVAKVAVYGAGAAVAGAVFVGTSAVAGPIAGYVAAKGTAAAIAAPTAAAAEWVGVAAAIIVFHTPTP